MNSLLRSSIRVAAAVGGRRVSGLVARPFGNTVVCATRVLNLGPSVGSAQAHSSRGFKTFKNKPAPYGQKRKVRSCVKKRFRVTGSGNIKYKCAGTRHNLGSKQTSQKRRLGKRVRSTPPLVWCWCIVLTAFTISEKFEGEMAEACQGAAHESVRCKRGRIIDGGPAPCRTRVAPVNSTLQLQVL